jgi:hypothetical protein
MLIGVFAVTCQENTYVGMHRLSTRFWKERCGKEVKAPPIADSRFRARLKKSAFSLEQVQDTFIKFFHRTTCDEVGSADKMMRHARGPVWPRQQPQPGIIPAGLHGLDTAATWSDRKSDGWVDGHGTFWMVACKPCLVGTFTWMRNSGHEAKRMGLETGQLTGLMTTIRMDSKADEQAWCFEQQRHIL